MDYIVLNIAAEFSDNPGARYIKEGSASGEEFYLDFLKPRYLEATKSGKGLKIILDGTSGYATSFLDESFGKLSREFGGDLVSKILEFVSDEEPYLISEINDEYIQKKYKKS